MPTIVAAGANATATTEAVLFMNGTGSKRSRDREKRVPRHSTHYS
jgi:hypothetical protein